MIEFYPEIRWLHMASALFSGVLFALRGALSFSPARGVAMAAPVRYLSYVVDTTLLTAALMLMSIVQVYPLADTWLTVKVVLIVVYIVLGWHALRGRHGRAGSLLLYLAALGVFLFIYSVARAHSPLGFFATLVS